MHMYKNVLLMKNGCEDCSMKTCLGVLLAESMNAKVTAAYVTGDFTWQELRKFYGLDELKWSGAARAGKNAKASAEEGKVRLAIEALESTKKMCADRGIPCETVHLSSRSPLHGVLKLAEEKRCDVIVTSTDPQVTINVLPHVRTERTNGKVRIPMLIHHAV
jgi:nucleotide-binding universal stress UspA family protein